MPAAWCVASKAFAPGRSLFDTLMRNLTILESINYTKIGLIRQVLAGRGEVCRESTGEARRGIIALTLLEETYQYLLTLLNDRWARREVGITPNIHADVAQVALLLAASYSSINDENSKKLNIERAQIHFDDYIGSRENQEGYPTEGGWIRRPDKLRSKQERSAFNECVKRIG